MIGLGPRLIEPLVEIVQSEGHEIDDAPARDPQPLPSFHLERRPGVLRHDLTRQDGHLCHPSQTFRIS